MDIRRKISARFNFLSEYEAMEYPIEDLDASVFRLDGEMGVLFDVDGTKVINETFNAISIRTSSFSSDGGVPSPKLVLSTRRTDPGFLDRFSVICAEFVNLGDNGRNRDAIRDDPFAWYSSWADMMGTKRGHRTPTAVIAELMTLDHLMISGENPVWEGASAGIIDIRSDSGDYEVKSSLNRDTNTIHVSSERQLLPGDKPLHLMYCCYQQSDSGVSIDEMVDRLSMHGFPRDDIESNLESLGYDRGKISRYERFALVKMWYFEVDDSFPRIIPESFVDGRMPLGITTIDYTVELSGVPHTEIEYHLDVPQTVETDFSIPRKWIESRLRKGKSVDDIRSLRSDPSAFSTIARNEEWPRETFEEWDSIIEGIIGTDRNRCWPIFIKRFSDSDIDVDLLERNCMTIVGDLDLRAHSDNCVRMMVRSPSGPDTWDTISGVMNRCADLGWNVFIVVTDNYRLGSMQIIDRLCENLKGSSESSPWQLINSYDDDLTNLDSDMLQLNRLDRSKYVLTCLRRRPILSQVYNWLMGCNKKENMRLLIIDHRSDVQTSVVRGFYKEMFVTDDLVDKLSGYTADKGDGENGFLNLGYVSFVPNSFHLLMNEHHIKRNPVDSFHNIVPLRPHLSSSQLFTREPCPYIIRSDTDLDILPSRFGYSDDIPDSLRDSVCWFICASAIAEYRGVDWTPYMFIMCDHNQTHACDLERMVRGYLNSEIPLIISDCQHIYAKQCMDPRVLSWTPEGFEPSDYPNYDDVSPIIRRLIISDNGVDVIIDDGDSVNTEYDILNRPSIVINYGSMFRPTEDSVLVSLYHVTLYNSRDFSMSPGPWAGNYNGNPSLFRMWMSNRSVDYFTRLRECDDSLTTVAESNHNSLQFRINDTEIEKLLEGKSLVWNQYDRCDFIEHVCDLCGEVISPGTLYHEVDNTGKQRCMRCYREHADQVLENWYGHIHEYSKAAADMMYETGRISVPELDLLTRSKKKSLDVINILKMQGYRFRIEGMDDYILMWTPRTTEFIEAVRSGADSTDIFSEFADSWRWIVNSIYAKEDLIEFISKTPNVPACLDSYLLMISDTIQDLEIDDTGYADISDNDDVYLEACSRVRYHVFTELFRDILAHCSEVTRVEGMELDYRDVILQFAVYPSGDDIPEETYEDISIILEDGIQIMTPEDVMPFSDFFNIEPGYENRLEYVIQLKESGF